MKKLLLLPFLALGLAGCSSTNPRVVTRINEDASLTGKLPYNPLDQKILTSWIDRKSATMSTLYGNDSAVQYARTHAAHDYPAGTVLSLVTWSQQEDPRWFGGSIPANAKSVEFVSVKAAADGNLTYSYEAYSGQPLSRTTQENGSAPNERAAYLLAQRSAVLP